MGELEVLVAAEKDAGPTFYKKLEAMREQIKDLEDGTNADGGIPAPASKAKGMQMSWQSWAACAFCFGFSQWLRHLLMKFFNSDYAKRASAVARAALGLSSAAARPVEQKKRASGKKDK